MNTLLWRTLGKALSILSHALIGFGLMAGISSPPYAQTATQAPDSYILTVERCVKYVASAQWVYRDYQWSFSITPTPCARKTPPEGTPFLWDELSRDYSNSRYWKNTHGMRHQLICHLAIARDKPQWNLEPWRPDVGYSKTLEAGCNHVIPLPEQAP
ncbi:MULTISPECIES: DUF2599 domain-containing protein [Pseudomonas]|uniref:DUF2599 domain-containing protein n=1 Tax=Pseudomonas frederiksbergensis TaxID=104087 RepID=A0A2S8HNE8_9PSED|nr:MULTISPECIES: DUF2599 domain-containing protein [Pseudomonas]PQP04066.1 hypothetical protein C5612_12630 [Pseudomonas frederiksbergensis]WLG53282.1 DUF2599 domain-containing protein [Pseudomonas sp. FP1742]